MDKAPIRDALRVALQAELAMLRSAALAAREGATHEEAKPENEYDTRGLEQSYLAGAQAARVDALASALEALEVFSLRTFGSDEPIALGACVVVDDGTVVRRYFICGVGGGTKLDVSGQPWWVLTPNSPLGRKLLGRRTGESIEHMVRGVEVDLEVLSVA